ncbi:MAG TPA: hypothetical protein VLM85_16205 [Polyangiaceae bacterium]|nr:hypothetical protein [Polyangiaceae bacterium]
MTSKAVLSLALVASSGLVALMPGCNSNEDPYKPVPAWSGKKVSLPAPPALPTDPIKSGDAYTVYGAIHHLNSLYHNAEVTSKDITIVGYIVDSNIPRAPACAVHKTGKKDPDDCKWSDGKDLQIPTIWISDSKTDEKAPRIRVMGFADNYANLFDANEKYQHLKDPPGEKDVVKDELWGVDIPFPLPGVGAKLKVTGRYGVNFAKSSTGIEADPMHGIMTYQAGGKWEYVEPPPPWDDKNPFFPQLKKK